MLFNSWQFGIFLPVVFLLYWSLPKKFQVILLFLASYYFYMSWKIKYVVLILFTTIISYLAARFLESLENKKAKRLILFLTLASCLGVLFVFKYFNFFSENFVSFMNFFAIKLHPVTLNLLLPVGISFYTFQTLSYVIDVYRGEIESEKNFIVYATFISFFPQLVAGPIERTKNLLPQIKKFHEFNPEQAAYGLKLLTWGFFKKLCIADGLAVYVDKVFNNIYEFQGFALILAAFFFTIQIYCDFSGYSDIARGAAKLFGIELMENFKSPYFSSSVKEFWSRWHISLSTWFRDYVYIPLGGNRVSKIRRNFNIMITFLISGLWHGANWNFLIWGGVHGFAQIIEKNSKNRSKNFLKIIFTFAFCVLAWIFFRTKNFSEAVYIFSNIFNNLDGGLKNYLHDGFFDIEMGRAVFASFSARLLLLILYDYCSEKFDVIQKITSLKNPLIRYAFYFGILTLIIFFRSVNNTEFVYFQF